MIAEILSDIVSMVSTHYDHQLFVDLQSEKNYAHSKQQDKHMRGKNTCRIRVT
jgi:N-acetyl-gamma-glutamylphosphate reductase